MPTSMTDSTTDEQPAGYGRKVGERLRAIRRQKGLSLQEVEATSRQEFKASVLGAYERGERAISVPRLQRLSRLYRVPVDQLLPRDEGSDFGHAEPETVLDLREHAPAPRVEFRQPAVTIDLMRLASLDLPGVELLVRYLQTIQVQRQDFNGRMLTIRREDLRAIACILDTAPENAAARLSDLGLCLT
jgi:transcriptional regulator with XRE-family HTH domain